MSLKTLNIDQALYGYLLNHSLREGPIQRALRDHTASLPEANMQIAPEQGQFMQWLVRLMGARRCLEVGVFTGYSALAVALALPEDGRLVGLDLSKEWTDIARGYWDQAGVSPRIELRLGPALESLDALLAEGQAGHFDFAFVDADKSNYLAYYERCLALVRPGGVIAFDNVLWAGAVADPAIADPDTNAIRALNEQLHHDERVDLSLVPIGDGLSLVRRRDS